MKKKLIRITTHDISLEGLLKGQLKFLQQHFEVIGVAADTGVLNKVAEREQIRVIDIPMKREISLKNDWQSLWKLYKLFKKEKPDIIHANTPKGSLLSMIAGKLAGVPIRIYTVTGLRYQGAQGKFRKLLQGMEKLTCACATHVIPEGNGVKHALQADYITTKPLEVVLNGNINGVDTDWFSPKADFKKREEIRRELAIDNNDFVFIFVGRIVGDKGMNELAEAMKKLSDKCTLILVGRFESQLDPLLNGNEQFFKTNQNIKFVGMQKDVRPYLNAADALIFPSYREGFPNVVLEAGAMGLPAIVTNINGCNEIIKDKINGVIIPSHSTSALLEAMDYFIQNRDEVNKMAAKSRDLIISRYNRNDVWKAILERYKLIIEA